MEDYKWCVPGAATNGTDRKSSNTQRFVQLYFEWLQTNMKARDTCFFFLLKKVRHINTQN